MVIDIGSYIQSIQDWWHWLKWDLKLWWLGLPIAWWCFTEFARTGDLGYLHDAIISLWPW